MKNSLLLYLKSIILAFAMIILANVAVAQTTLYSTDFGTSNAFPTGWTASGGTTLWTDNSTSPSSGYTGASGGDNADNGTSGTAILIFNNGLSTAVYSGIVVTWGGRMTSTGASPTFQWSIDGTNWNTVAFTDVTNNSTWGLVTVNLPSGASGVSNLEFRWTSNSAAGTYRMDDFTVKGTSTTGAQGPTGPTGATGSTGATGATGTTRSAIGIRICRLNFWLTSFTIGTGSKTFTTNLASTATAFTVGNRVRMSLFNNSHPELYGQQVFRLLHLLQLTLTVNVDYVGGTGTWASWAIFNITVAGAIGSTGATGATGVQGITGPGQGERVNGDAGNTGGYRTYRIAGANGVQGTGCNRYNWPDRI